MKSIILTLSILIAFVSCEPIKTKPVKSSPANPIKPTPVVKPTMNLVSLGDVPDSDIKFVKKELEDFYHVTVIVHKQIPLDPKLRAKGTEKYQANAILKFLEGRFKNSKGKVLAITSKDICTERELNGTVYKNWGVFGLGSLGGKSCVVSTHRFGSKHFDRLSKVTIHEIGHTLGIPHCESNSDCLMNDAKGKGGKVDTEKKWICGSCKKKIKW